MATSVLQDTNFTPECEVYDPETNSLQTLYDNCKKNPGHKNFIPVNEFGVENLPTCLQAEESVVDYVRVRCDLTVKAHVRYTSLNRPDTFSDGKSDYPYHQYKGNDRVIRTGTGYVYSLEEAPFEGVCPCQKCTKSVKNNKPAEKEFYKLFVQTSTHVVYDDSEACKAEFHCFYDTEDKKGIQTLYGIKVCGIDGSEMFRTDTCKVMCVTHEKSLWQRLHQMYQRSLDFPSLDMRTQTGFLISHPHGCSKHISVGTILSLTFPPLHQYAPGVPLKFKGQVICRLPLFPWSRDAEEFGTSFNSDSSSSPSDGLRDDKLATSPKTPSPLCEMRTNAHTDTSDCPRHNPTSPNVAGKSLSLRMRKITVVNSSQRSSMDKTTLEDESTSGEHSTARMTSDLSGSGRKIDLCARNVSSLPSASSYMKSQVNFYKQSTESTKIEPGTEFLLPRGMAFTLPLESKFVFRFHCGLGRWFTFPPGTRLSLPDGRNGIFPPEAEFYLNQILDFDVFSVKCCMVYAIPACPGCSGAPIYHGEVDRELAFPFSTHAGALNEPPPGLNRSGLGYIMVQSV